MTIRVAVAEDNYLVREGIVTAIGLVDDAEVVATCGSYDELVAAVERTRPDVVVTDIRMPPTGTDEGIRAAQHLRATAPHIGVVVLSQHVESALAIRLHSDGSEGRAYLLKERVGDVNELARSERSERSGESLEVRFALRRAALRRRRAVGQAPNGVAWALHDPGMAVFTRITHRSRSVRAAV